jgi:cell fate regulator YaaT (PSP1 superfamily)
MPKYVVRYGAMRFLGVFATRGSEKYRRASRVIARTNRGLEAGEVLCEATEDAVQYLKDPPSGQILRAMTADDENELAHLKAQEGQEFQSCQSLVLRLGLEMQLVDIERLFGGERVVVYYLAEQRVDFRQLVKELAGELQTRIEMRQIGVRDEAKLLADYGDCGKPVCCNTYLSAMPPVSMKMAKIQKATLDPTKISGRCGRLKCCLRYEFPVYEEIQKRLPPIGAEVETPEGRGRILAQEILSEQLLIHTDDERRVLVNAGSVRVLSRKGDKKKFDKSDKSDEGRRSEPPPMPTSDEDEQAD